MENAPNHLPVVRTSTHNRSRITNGSELLRGVDGRSAEARRYRDLVVAYKAEFGHDLSQSEMAAIKQAAWLTVRSEDMQAAQLRGQDVNDEESTRVANSLSRALRELRLMHKRRAPRPAGRYELDAIADGLKKGAGG
jgi:hypothetical protein